MNKWRIKRSEPVTRFDGWRAHHYQWSIRTIVDSSCNLVPITTTINPKCRSFWCIPHRLGNCWLLSPLTTIHHWYGYTFYTPIPDCGFPWSDYSGCCLPNLQPVTGTWSHESSLPTVDHGQPLSRNRWIVPDQVNVHEHHDASRYVTIQPMELITIDR